MESFHQLYLGCIIIAYSFVVSILVLMESFHQPQRFPRSRQRASVSILVLMESFHQLFLIAMAYLSLGCFNPCFNGILPSTYTTQRVHPMNIIVSILVLMESFHQHF